MSLRILFALLLFGCVEVSDPDFDGDGSPDIEDCAPDDPERHPGASDPIDDGIDQNCDGLDGVDADQDGWLAPESGGEDCDDLDPSIHPGAVELPGNSVDEDCDGVTELCDMDGDGLQSVACGGTDCDDDASDCGAAASCADEDGDGARVCDGDCDDSDPNQGPGFTELCDGIDNDCSGDVAEATEVDADLDGVAACAGDCDDDDPNIGPEEEERCDGLDTDCDGSLGEGELDGDGDGWLACAPYSGDDPEQHGGDCDDTEPLCTASCQDVDGDGVFACAGDCDDAQAGVGPGQPEVCDGFDSDCDGLIPEVELDLDGDGWLPCGPYVGPDPELEGGDCDPDESLCGSSCEDADGDGVYVCAGDCDDGDAAIFPGNWDDAWGDGVDSSCDGEDWYDLASPWIEIGFDEANLAGFACHQLGTNTAVLPDLDGDGLPELAVADRGLAVPANASSDNRGGAFIIPSSLLLPGVLDIHDVPARLEGTMAYGRAGSLLRRVADLDGDGLDDLAIGEPDARVDPYGAGAGIVSFLPASDLLTPQARSIPDVALGGINGPDNSINLGGGATGIQEIGSGAVVLGDLDGDGLPEAAVASARANGWTGRVWIVAGSSLVGGALLVTDLAAIELADPGHVRFGQSLAAGDLDGDGLPELLVGGAGTSAEVGWVRILAGADLASGVATSGGDAWRTVTNSGGIHNSAPRLLPDLDGDGLPELAYGFPIQDSDSSEGHGQVCLWFSGTLLASTEDILDCETSADVVIGGVEDEGEVGRSLAVGDFDGDGLGDLAIVDRGERLGAPLAGAVHLFRGSSLQGGGTFELYDADASGYAELTFGYPHLAVSAGDIDGDGRDDLIIGASNADFISPSTGALVEGRGAVWIHRSPW